MGSRRSCGIGLQGFPPGLFRPKVFIASSLHGLFLRSFLEVTGAFGLRTRKSSRFNGRRCDFPPVTGVMELPCLEWDNRIPTGKRGYTMRIQGGAAKSSSLRPEELALLLPILHVTCIKLPTSRQ